MKTQVEASRPLEDVDRPTDHAEGIPKSSSPIEQKLVKTAFELLAVEPPIAKGGGVQTRTLYHQPGGGTVPDTD